MFLVIISALSLVSCCETLYVVIRARPISRHAVYVYTKARRFFSRDPIFRGMAGCGGAGREHLG